MNTLIVVSYPDLDTARRAAAELATLRERAVVSLEGVVIVECAADGQLRTHPIDPGHAASGSLIGRAIARIETALGASHERPVDDALIAAFAPLGGEVTDTTLSIDDELKLVEAISHARDGDDAATG
ncbi:hypothetical protein [Burkholderia sp. BCC1977]|uniref:hypothetical protein n=1 Tax=Burkholderia sp. BCC1977 TaxID=2817440 RepID=UPI002ABE41A0|nr:hypothetical protein [Burkholderia sp. BCC1977]